MSFLKESTKWVLFLASSGQAEQRHIMDIAFGIRSLEIAGVLPENIFIYIDGSDRAIIDQWVSHGSKSKYEIKPTADFFLEQRNNTRENLVMFITGHGSIEGLDCAPVIKPSNLVGALKSSPNLRRAVVYLGQCDAGIFNYMSAGRRAREPEEHDPDIILAGATNLHSSISSSTREVLATGELSWVANVFLLFVFKWMQSPVDVDGDGKLTIMDSYKFAGSRSNFLNKQGKLQGLHNCISLNPRLAEAEAACQADPTNKAVQLAYEATKKRYIFELEMQFVHQECWILNSRPAQEWEI